MATVYSRTSIQTECIYEGLHITLREKERRLQNKGRSLSLTPIECRLCKAFFQRWQENKQEPIMKRENLVWLTYLSATELQTSAALASRQLLRKHISNLTGKMVAFQIQIKAFENGYILLWTKM